MINPRYILVKVKKDRAVPVRYQRAGWLVFDTLNREHGGVWANKEGALADMHKRNAAAERQREV